jgi:hypothetical protein
VMLRVLSGTYEPAELARLDELSIDDQENVQYVQQLRVYVDLMDNRLSEARRMAEELAALDPLNAAVLLVVAGHAATWERDAEAAHRIETSLRQAPSRGRYVDALRRAIRASVDGLEGRRRESLAGFVRAAREFEELGVVVDRALNAIDMAVVLGTDMPEVRAEVDVARSVLERLNAAPYLAHLERHAGTEGSAVDSAAAEREPVLETAEPS